MDRKRNKASQHPLSFKENYYQLYMRLSQNEKILRFLVDNSKQIILIINRQGKIIFANKAASLCSGYSEEEIIGQSILKFLTADSKKKTLYALVQEFLGKPQPEIEIGFKAKTGEIKYLRIEAGSAPFYENEKQIGLLITAFDITDIKKVQEELIKSEHKFRRLWENAPVAYHILDTKGIIKEVNKTEVLMLGYSQQELIGKSIFDLILPEQREEAKERFKKKIAGKDLPKAENRIYLRKDGTRIFVDISDVIEKDAKGKIIGVREAMVDITERKKAEEKIQTILESQKSLILGIVKAISTMVEIRDPYTAGHQARVAQLSCAIALEMGLPKDKIDGLRIAALIHDVGKMLVPTEILSKPGHLNEMEVNLIRYHVQFGYETIKSIEFPWPVKEIIMQHHEKIDGSGYPAGLKGNEILPEAKIIAVADVIEAMTSNRPYRSANSLEEALKEIKNNSGCFYDSEVVNVCLKLFLNKNFTFTNKNHFL